MGQVTLRPVEKAALPKSISTKKREIYVPPAKSIMTKLEACGPVASGTVARMWGGGAFALVVVGNDRRLAIIANGDKTAHLVESVPAGLWFVADLRDDNTVLLEDRREPSAWTYREVALPSGESNVVYVGAPLSTVRLGPPGYAVGHDATSVTLLKLDGGTTVSTLALAQLGVSQLGTQGGRIQIVHSEKPYEIVAIGVYGETLRVIGRVAEQFANQFCAADGRVFAQSLSFYELVGLAAAYADEHDRDSKSPASSGALAFRYIDAREVDAPESIRMLRDLDHQRGDILPCSGGYAVLLDLARGEHVFAIVEASTRKVTGIDLPRGKAYDMRVDDSGTRALWYCATPRKLVEISLPAGTTRTLTVPSDLPAGELMFDFADGSRVVAVVAGTVRLYEASGDALVELGRTPLVGACSLGTTAAGRGVVVDDGSSVAVIGVYGSELRRVGELARPTGAAHAITRSVANATAWRRIGARLFTGRTEVNELVGVGALIDRNAS